MFKNSCALQRKFAFLCSAEFDALFLESKMVADLKLVYINIQMRTSRVISECLSKLGKLLTSLNTKLRGVSCLLYTSGLKHEINTIIKFNNDLLFRRLHHRVSCRFYKLKELN